MSLYKDESDFVNRCLEITKKEGLCEPDFEVTKVLCLSLGLLVFAKERIGRESDAVDSSLDWGEIWKKDEMGNSKTPNDVAWHLRNAVCHGRFEVQDNEGSGNITHVRFCDVYDHGKSNKSDKSNMKFVMTLSIEEFQNFIIKYAEYYIDFLKKERVAMD